MSQTQNVGAVLDLHCHTVLGSPDSQLTLRRLATAAQRRHLTAACVTEHDNVWSTHDEAYYSQCIGITFIRGMEVATDLGHVITYGLDTYYPEMADAEVLRKAVSEAGGVMIAAHPFRRTLINPSPDRYIPPFRTLSEAASPRLFTLVDEIEVLNGGTDALENYLALTVARELGFRGVAGSDAHIDEAVGKHATLFDSPVTTVAELLRELKAGRFNPATSGAEMLSPYTWEEASVTLNGKLQAALAELS